MKQTLVPRLQVHLSIQSLLSTQWRAVGRAGAVCLIGTIFAACSSPEPQRAGEADPARMAVEVASMQIAAMSGDQEQVKRSFQAAHADLMRSMKVPDPTRRIDRETARATLRDMQSIRSVAWIDHENLLAIVATNEDRSLRTIDEVCTRLRPLGDTLGVVVNLQSAVATRPEDLDVLSRNCDLPSGERAFAQRNRQVGVVAPEIRAAHRAATAASLPDASQFDPAEARRRADEAMRVLEASTPELMQHPGRQ